MKKAAILLLLALTACQKHDPVADEFEAQVQGYNTDCGLPVLVVLDNPAKAAALVGAGKDWAAFVAVNLDTAFWQHQRPRLLVRIRQVQPSEAPFCKTFGPGNPPLTVVSARVK